MQHSYTLKFKDDSRQCFKCRMAPVHIRLIITPRSLKFNSLFGFCLVCILCSGCRSDLDSVLENYQDRIGNIFPHDVPTGHQKPSAHQKSSDTETYYRLPPASELTLPWPESTISLLDSFKLHRCAVALPIMQKNSTLGKFHSVSQRLILESKIVHLLPACIKHPNISVSLSNKLQTAYQQKIQGQQQRVWSALFASREFQQFASLSNGLLSLKETHVDIAGSQALEYWFKVFKQVLQQQPIEAQPLESSLQQLTLNPALGQWIRSSRVTLSMLKNTTVNIQAYQGICLKPIKPLEKNRIQNVFQRFFIKDVQPLVSRLKRLGDRLQIALTGLHAKASDINTAATDKLSNYLDHLFGASGLHIQLQQRFGEQVQAWQILLKNCQLVPGNRQQDRCSPTAQSKDSSGNLPRDAHAQTRECS